jgi:hypothetical protein
MYDDLVVIYRNDEARGTFTRDTYDTPNIESEGFDMSADDLVWSDAHCGTPYSDTPLGDAPPTGESSQASGSKNKRGTQRLTASLEVMQAMVERVGDVASSVLKLQPETVNKSALLQDLLELQG